VLLDRTSETGSINPSGIDSFDISQGGPDEP